MLPDRLSERADISCSMALYSYHISRQEGSDRAPCQARCQSSSARTRKLARTRLGWKVKGDGGRDEQRVCGVWMPCQPARQNRRDIGGQPPLNV